jgi:hypothetical protein
VLRSLLSLFQDLLCFRLRLQLSLLLLLLLLVMPLLHVTVLKSQHRTPPLSSADILTHLLLRARTAHIIPPRIPAAHILMLCTSSAFCLAAVLSCCVTL